MVGIIVVFRHCRISFCNMATVHSIAGRALKSFVPRNLLSESSGGSSCLYVSARMGLRGRRKEHDNEQGNTEDCYGARGVRRTLWHGDGRSEGEPSAEGQGSDGDEGTGTEAASGKGSRACCAHRKGSCSGQAYAAGCEGIGKGTHSGAFRADASRVQARGLASRASAPRLMRSIMSRSITTIIATTTTITAPRSTRRTGARSASRSSAGSSAD